MEWNPDAYGEFADQRARPFVDLLDLLPLRLPGGRLLDLGCGDGRLTRLAASRLGMGRLVGVDSSEPMLAAARDMEEGDRESWRFARIEDVLDEPDTYDVVLANASLQFLSDHATLFPRVLDRVAPGGWVAVQLPYNHIARSHLLMEAAARAEDLEGALDGVEVTWPQERPEVYVRMLQAHRFEYSLVQLRTYRHPLDGAESIVSWMKTGGLQPWLDALDPTLRPAYLDVYTRLIRHAYPAVEGDIRLLDYTRLLIVGRRP